MQIKITFLGAAQNVTGSCYLIETNGLRVLIDCGMYQEWQLKKRNWEPFPVSPDSIDCIMLTHAHLDHSGLIPRLVGAGFRNPIYCTEATAEIAEIILLDSAHILEEDAEFKKKRHNREGRKSAHPEVPLYTQEDARACSPLFSPTRYGKTVNIGEGMEATFHDAGHTLGSSMLKLTISKNGDKRTIIFSGDMGRPDKPLLEDPTFFQKADYVFIESTYGDRVLELPQDMPEQIAAVVNDTVRAGGNIVIPSFALERAQELLYYFNNLLREDRIPRLMVFLDSPMAVSITEVFKHHKELMDKEMRALLEHNQSPFEFSGLKLVRTPDESKAINSIKGTVIIIAGSGMCSGGRIKHHLVTNIPRRDSTILFVGYQAMGTLGRQIVDGAKEVRILGKNYRVRAKIVQLHGFSGHADRDQLLQWLSAFRQPPRRLFITHGEPESARHFAELVKEKLGWDIHVPAYKEEVILD